MLISALNPTVGWILTSSFSIILAGFLVPYFRDPYHLRKYPGPILAKISYAWLLWVGISGRRSQIIHKIHKKYGPIIRISPSEISFSHPAAYSDVYSFGKNKATKSTFYDAFASIGLTNVFTSRSKTEHSQKRKLLHSLFTAEIAREFSRRTCMITSTLLDKWATRHVEKESCFDCVPWISFLALDEMADFVFGESFGMVTSASDLVPAPKDMRLGLDMAAPPDEYPTQHISLTSIVSSRETYNYLVGVLPPWWKAVGRRILRVQFQASTIFSGFVAHRLLQRLSTPTEAPHDLVGRFLLKVDAQEDFRPESLLSELITILVAGSDTTRNSLIAAIYYLAKSSDAQHTLHRELDTHMSSPISDITIENLPFLGACLNETLRLFSPVPLGLPRTVPEEGMMIRGEHFVGGTTVGVPIYTIHHDEAVWGENPGEFRPERWLNDGNAKLDFAHAFKPFSDGPASCIGRQMALTQLRVMIALVFKRFEIHLEDPADPLRIEDWFVRRVTECRIGVRRRYIGSLS
ncbi:cytochrome P450 monooxygenase [Mycena maculata]|uniref:Cytochrome P450 monooxygenase n=1 Tax=Mycena maculata TaxID=230809 RepID=A0AAD7J0E7_9AGAR|nr:cytochrome P450 monooxygenase [Mycena maculata]